LFIDAPQFYESSFWNSNPESGLGGWGDPNDDYSVQDGGFRELLVSYPSPHIIRRNFTLRPFNNGFVGFADTDPNMEANETFSASAVEKILELTDYREFQKELEAVVRFGRD